MVEKRSRDDAEALGEARRRKLQNETVPSDAAAAGGEQKPEPMQEDEDDDQSVIPQTPPPQGSAALHAPEPGALKNVAANSLHMDPSGDAKVYNSRDLNGAAGDAATIARMAAVTVADREAAAVECPMVTFHHHLPVLTELTRVLTDTEIDALGMEWRVLWYPHGPYLDDVFVSVFVEMVPPSAMDDELLDEADALGGTRPPPVTRAVEVEIILIRQGDKLLPDYRRVSSVHDFSEQNPEFGMSRFIARKELLKPENEFLTSDGHVELEIRLHSIVTDGQEDANSATSDCSNLVYPPPSPVANEATVDAVNAAAALASSTHQDLMMYDSKQETGMVGLKNQGATCYMNSLLQTLFHLHAFRQVVYATPSEQEDTNDSVSLALQRVFYRLQMQNKAVSTKELTRSFGWSQIDSFMQHDVQELYRILCDRLEEKMKHTKVDGTIKNLFEGKVQSFIQCVNVDYQSFRDESFYDLQLLVKDCKDIYESFRKYVEVEMLQGDDQYEAEGYGKQDARKGLRFLQFPPVLNIQLRRFEYDPMRDGMVKIHDRFEFPKVLVLDEFVDPSDDDKSSENEEKKPAKPKHVYHLHSVLVHSGDVHGGHYYVFIRPAKDIASSSEWFKFDDDQISRVDEQMAVEGNFGSSATVNGHTEQSSSYSAMLSPDGSGATDGQNMGFRSALEDDERTEDVYDFTQSNSPGPSNGSLMMPLGRSFSSAYMLVYVRDGDNDTQQLEGITDEENAPVTDVSAEEDKPTDTDATAAQADESVPIPEGLLKRFHEEERATARRKKMQQTEHLYMTLRIASDWTVSKLKKITKTMDFSSFSNNSCVRIRIKRTATIRQLYQRIYAFKGVPVHRQRLWKVITRENRTNRPDSPLTDELLDMPVNILIDEDASPKSPVRLYLQILSESSAKKVVLHRHFWSEFTPPEHEEQDEGKQEGGDDEEEDYAAILPLEECEFAPSVDPHDIMLFIKCYDVTKKLGHRLEYKGNLLIDARKTGADLERAIKEALDIPPTTRLRLYEEVQPITVSEVEKGGSLVSAEIQHGDIICYQFVDAKHTESASPEDTASEKSVNDATDVAISSKQVEMYPNVESYFQYLMDRVEVVFHQYNHPDEDPFALMLLYSNHYDDIIDAVAEHLGLGMAKRLHLRLYQHSPLSNQPKKSPLRHSKYAGDRATTLDDLLTEYMERTNILYYEILPNPITEIEAKKQVMVYFSIYDECFVDPSAPTTSRRLELLVLPTYTVQDLVRQIKQTFELSEETALRVCEVSHGGTMIQRILAEDTPLEKFWSPSSGYTSTNDHHGLFVEKIPDEELAEDAITVLETGSEDDAEKEDDDDNDDENALFHVGVVHFNFQINTSIWIHPHGVPFVVYFRESDTIGQLKARMRKRYVNGLDAVTDPACPLPLMMSMCV